MTSIEMDAHEYLKWMAIHNYANSEPFRTPVPIESVHRFRRFHTLAEEKLVAAGAR